MIMLPQPSLENFTHILRFCTKEMATPQDHRSPAYMLLKAVPAVPGSSASSQLITELLEDGNVVDVLKIFEGIESRRGISWDSVINGHIKSGECVHALNLSRILWKNSLHLDSYTICSLLQACSRIKDAEIGNDLYQYIAKSGLLDTDDFVGCAFVDMYAKCRLLSKAREVFEILPVRDVVTWTALISGYSRHELGNEALNFLQEMQIEGVSPNAATFVCILNACGNIRLIDEGRKIHGELEINGLLEINIFAGNALLDMYAKCGDLQEAQAVFNKLPNRDRVSWNTLIGAYVEHNCIEEALKCVKEMENNQILPNYITYLWCLRACNNIGSIENGRKIHDEIEKKGFLRENAFLSTALVDIYSKCDTMDEAQTVFDGCRTHDVVYWNTLIAGYTEHDQGIEALECLKRMRLDGVCPSPITYICILKACADTGSIEKGQEIHAEIARAGLLGMNLSLGTALIDMYARCNMLGKAHEIFDKLSIHDISSWNALISGYSDHDYSEQVLSCFRQMQLQGIDPDSFIFFCIMKAVTEIGCTMAGMEIHAEFARTGKSRDLIIGSMLVDMYAKIGWLTKAQEIFDQLRDRDSISWTALIVGYVQHGCNVEALGCLKQMQQEGFPLDAVTYTCLLNICCSTGDIVKGREIHGEIMRKGFLEKDISLSNSLIDMYAKSKRLMEAQDVLYKLPVRDIVSWNTLIAGCVKHENGEAALHLFKQMQCDGLSPDTVTFSCFFKACGSVGVSETGMKIHANIGAGLLASSPIVTASLIDMYAKCGLLTKAREVFENFQTRDIVSWNSLITGYAQLGDVESVLVMFDRMVSEGYEPDSITCISILNACSHAGMIDAGQFIFKCIIEDPEMASNVQHIICMIDLLTRAGKFEKAFAILHTSPSQPNVVMWLVLLSSCTKYGDIELGSHIFRQILELCEKEAGAYICMGAIYACVE